MRTLFEHRYRLPHRKLVVVTLLCLAMGVGFGILLAVQGMDVRPRKLVFLYDLWPLGAVILQWAIAIGLTGAGLWLLRMLQSTPANWELLVRVTDRDIAWGAAANPRILPLSQVSAVERQPARRGVWLVVKTQQDEIVVNSALIGEAKFEELAATLEKVLGQES